MALGSKIHENDQYWAWKFILRLLLTIFCIVAIGLIAYLVAPSTASDSETTGVGGIAWVLIPLGLSVVWSCVSVPVLFARKRPVHPGFNVAFDLILSLALGVAAGIITGWAVVSLYSGYNSTQDFGTSGSYTDGNDYDSYNQPSGGTGFSGSASYTTYYDIRNNLPYVYISSNGQNQTRSPGGVNYFCPNYDSCADQSAAGNSLNHMLNIFPTAGVMLCIVSILQFILFVWACIDCHAYNRHAVYDHRARELADKMIADMRSRGELLPAATAYQQQTQQMVPLMRGGQTASPMMGPDYLGYHSNEITPVGSPRPSGPVLSPGVGYQAVQQHATPDYPSDARPSSLSIGSSALPVSSSQHSGGGRQAQMHLMSTPAIHVEQGRL